MFAVTFVKNAPYYATHRKRRYIFIDAFHEERTREVSDVERRDEETIF